MQNPNLQALLAASLSVLGQLQRLAATLAQRYCMQLELLSGNTIGKHYRHIIEFYQCLLTASDTVNYDNRRRDTELENDYHKAVAAIGLIINTLREAEALTPMQYEADFSTGGGETVTMTTSFMRELAYNVEHAVHHMAIIQMVIKHHFPDIVLEDQFGVAASTQRYQQQAHVYSDVSAHGAG